jgi:hypothetical protein
MIIHRLIRDNIIPRHRAADALDAVSRVMWYPVKVLMGRDHIPHTMNFEHRMGKHDEVTMNVDIDKHQTRDTVEVTAGKVLWTFNLTQLLTTMGITVGVAAAARACVVKYVFGWQYTPWA